MDIVDQTMLSLLDGVDHGAATVVTLGTTAAARELWSRIRRRAKKTGQPHGEEQRAVLAAEPGQTVNAGVLHLLVQEIPRYDLRSWAAQADSYSIGRDYITGPFRAGGDYIAGDKRVNHVQGNQQYIEHAVNVCSGPATGAAGQGSGSPAQQRLLRDVGIITVLSEETQAIAAALSAAGSHRQRVQDGLHFGEAETGTAGQAVTVVTMQALGRGQRAAVAAFGHMLRYYSPATVVLAGIAGGISPAVRLGDVVIAQQVIYYDLRKEQPGETVRSGRAWDVPAVTQGAVNAFFSAHGEPYRARIRGRDHAERTCQVLRGPIGSGEAVIAHRDSEVRRYLTGFNYKTLALETEAGGFAEGFYGMGGVARPGAGWLVVRGISDHADEAKDDLYHEIASWHAAQVVRQLLPYLKPAGSTQH